MNEDLGLQKIPGQTTNFLPAEESLTWEKYLRYYPSHLKLDFKRPYFYFCKRLADTTWSPFSISLVDMIVDTHISTQPASINEVIRQFQQQNWTIENLEETALFWEANPEVRRNLNEAIECIKRRVKKQFSLKLKVEKDPEVENFKTLVLLIAGRFKPKEAFSLLQKIDAERLIDNIGETTKFNVNVEFL